MLNLQPYFFEKRIDLQGQNISAQRHFLLFFKMVSVAPGSHFQDQRITHRESKAKPAVLGSILLLHCSCGFSFIFRMKHKEGGKKVE